MQIFKNVYKHLIDSLFPILCFGCLKEGVYICKNCRKKINFLDPHKRPLCAVSYKNEIIRQIIHAIKYEHVKSVDTPIACIMDGYLKDNNFRFAEDWIVSFVPMHPRKQEMRGYNQSKLIAEKLAKQLGLQCRSFLIKTVHTQAQMQLAKNARLTNLADVFQAEKSAFGRKIILIDDVCTTGSTLLECEKTLLAAGARRVLCYAFAKD